VIDRSGVDRVLAANRYLVLGTADELGQPWATPVFFAPLDPHRVCWVSAPDSRHSRNIARRTRVAITVFDSTVEVGRGEAAYFDADAAPATPGETSAALRPSSPAYRSTSGSAAPTCSHLDRWSSTVPTCATGISLCAAAMPSSGTTST
jgi:hypothetical protein